MMVRIGLTGGIGTGKSYVASLIHSHFGIPVYDCDSSAKRLMAESTEVRGALEQLLGQAVCKPDGTLDRQLLASYVFGNKEAAQSIEKIVHPAVKADFQEWTTQFAQQPAPPRAVLIESAILIEAGFTDVADKVIVVEAPMELRIARVMKRDGCTEQQVRERIARQMSDSDRRNAADAVIINDGRHLISQLQAAIN
jgi:dephospho-CoA kinase